MRYDGDASTEEEELGPDDLGMGCPCVGVFDKITEKEEFFGVWREMLGLSCCSLSQLPWSWVYRASSHHVINETVIIIPSAC
jgi:hypothetical protein